MKLVLLFSVILTLTKGHKELYRYLNSYHHCDSKPTIVDKDTTYILKADAQPGTYTQSSLVSCEAVFRSAYEDGQLCVVQDGSLSMLGDPNAELSVKDGYADDEKEIFTIKYSTNTWQCREYCTTSPFLTFYFSRINQKISVDISKLNIHFKVREISNRNRKIYMDELYCNYEYILHNSVVSVYNRAPLTGTNSDSVTSTCAVTVRKQSNGESRICFAYSPSKLLSPQALWLFRVSKNYSLEDESTLYKLTWDDPRAQNVHYWCASNEMSRVRLIFQRLQSNMTIEPPEALRFVVADFDGPESELFKLLAVDNDSHQSLDQQDLIIIILSIVAFVFFIVVIILLITIKKKKRISQVCHRDYKVALNPRNDKT